MDLLFLFLLASKRCLHNSISQANHVIAVTTSSDFCLSMILKTLSLHSFVSYCLICLMSVCVPVTFTSGFSPVLYSARLSWHLFFTCAIVFSSLCTQTLLLIILLHGTEHPFLFVLQRKHKPKQSKDRQRVHFLLWEKNLMSLCLDWSNSFLRTAMSSYKQSKSSLHSCPEVGIFPSVSCTYIDGKAMNVLLQWERCLVWETLFSSVLLVDDVVLLSFYHGLQHVLGGFEVKCWPAGTSHFL